MGAWQQARGEKDKVEMTKERLEAYRSEKQEIQELKAKLQALRSRDYIGNDVIMDYRSGYPVPQSVIGTDWAAYDSRKQHLISEFQRLQRRCQEVEQWIDAIPDSLTRRIFRMYYEDAQGQQAIAKHLHVNQSQISRKIDKYIKVNT